MNTLRNGSGPPAGGLGINGDFYIDTDTWEIYGPKTGGSWGGPTAMVGEDGDDGADATIGGSNTQYIFNNGGVAAGGSELTRPSAGEVRSAFETVHSITNEAGTRHLIVFVNTTDPDIGDGDVLQFGGDADAVFVLAENAATTSVGEIATDAQVSVFTNGAVPGLTIKGVQVLPNFAIKPTATNPANGMFGGGTGVFFFGEASVNPSSNPSAGIVLFTDSADNYLKYRREDGSVIVLNGSGSPGGDNKSIQWNNAGAFGGQNTLTRESADRLHAATTFYFTYGAAVGGTFGSEGMWRVPAVPGEGDPIPLISGADGNILQLEGGGYTIGNSSAGLTFVADSASGVTFNTGLGTVAFDGSVTVGQTVTAEDVAVNNDLTIANDAAVTGNLTVDGDINGSVVNLTTEIVTPEVNCTSIFVQQGAVIAGVATKSERLPVVRTSSTTPLATTIHTMADETTVSVEMTVVMARRTNVTKAARYKQTVTYRRTGGGVATQVGATITETAQETTAGDDAVISTDGTTGITAVVTAADTDPRNWTIYYRVIEVTAA